MMENKRGRPQSLKITKRTINIDIRATFFTVCVTFILVLHRKTAFDFFLTVFISTHFRRISKNFNLGRSVFNKEEFHVFSGSIKNETFKTIFKHCGGLKTEPLITLLPNILVSSQNNIESFSSEGSLRAVWLFEKGLEKGVVLEEEDDKYLSKTTEE